MPKQACWWAATLPRSPRPRAPRSPRSSSRTPSPPRWAGPGSSTSSTSPSGCVALGPDGLTCHPPMIYHIHSLLKSPNIKPTTTTTRRAGPPSCRRSCPRCSSSWTRTSRSASSTPPRTASRRDTASTWCVARKRKCGVSFCLSICMYEQLTSHPPPLTHMIQSFNTHRTCW